MGQVPKKLIKVDLRVKLIIKQVKAILAISLSGLMMSRYDQI